MSFYDYKHTFSYPKSSPKIVVLKVSNSKGLKSGAPCQIRTGDLLIRTQMLYPTELMALKKDVVICHTLPLVSILISSATDLPLLNTINFSKLAIDLLCVFHLLWSGVTTIYGSEANSMCDEITLDSNQFIRLVSASHRLRL